MGGGRKVDRHNPKFKTNTGIASLISGIRAKTLRKFGKVATDSANWQKNSSLPFHNVVPAFFKGNVTQETTNQTVLFQLTTSTIRKKC